MFFFVLLLFVLASNLNCPSIKVFWRFISNRLSQLNTGSKLFERLWINVVAVAWKRVERGKKGTFNTWKIKVWQNGCQIAFGFPGRWAPSMGANKNDDEIQWGRKKELEMAWYPLCAGNGHDFLDSPTVRRSVWFEIAQGGNVSAASEIQLVSWNEWTGDVDAQQ